MSPTPSPVTDQAIATVLERARVFALVGVSAKVMRPSYFVMKYLLAKGYQVIPVNPGLAGQDLLGQRVFATLTEIDRPFDVVDIFRNSQAALEITREAITLKDHHGIEVIWMQLGVVNDIARAEGEDAGLKVVMDRCPKIEYGRLSGEIGWAGVNSGTVSARRPQLAATGVQDHRLRSKSR